MKSMTAIAALFGIAFAAASASSAFAQSGAPGTPSKPNKVTAVPPPPPPPGGPDKYTTQTRPPGPGAGLRKPRGPNVVDDLTGGPVYSQSHGGSTCGADPETGVAVPACVDSLAAKCNGGMRTNDDGTVTCVPRPAN